MTAIHDCDTWTKALERYVDWFNSCSDVTESEAFDKAAEIFDSEHFGVESVTLHGTDDDSSAASMRYLNMGDTYATTLILTDDYVDGVALIVSSWGDWYESAENHYNEENNTIRCGHCSKLTPCADPYEDTVCEGCGNKYQ